MKKGYKGLLVLSFSLLIGGCSCSNNEATPQVIETYNVNHIYDDYSNNFENLYNEAVKSTVRVSATSSSGGTSLGSGVVYKEEGNYAYILTNAHVLTNTSGADYYNNIEITFSDYSRVKGTYIYLDKNEDVGVVRVDKNSSYKVAKIVESDTASKVGETVFSIGQPNGQYFAVTTGILSFNRLNTSTSYISGNNTTMTYVFNSTATINTGNSGGPLFNSKGEVIAINSMIPPSNINGATTNDHNYSIPINYFIKVADYLVINRASYVRPYLNIEGRSICDYSTNSISSLGITVKKGIHVTSSGESEISTGRVITEVNGNAITTIEDFEFELLKYSKNDIISITHSDVGGTSVRTVNVRMR